VPLPASFSVRSPGTTARLRRAHSRGCRLGHRFEHRFGHRLGHRFGRCLGVVTLLLLSAVLAAVDGPARAASLEALFAPKADLWRRWAAHDEAQTERIDHAPWDRLIAGYRVAGYRVAGYRLEEADGVARFAYGRVSTADRAALDAYLLALQAVPIRRYPRAEQFAYWVNLYNALTVQLVLDRYPIGSIRDINISPGDISPGLFASGPWDAPLLAIDGERVSLNDIEHRILRPIWRDPRIHYAVNCASIGCPDLPPRAFTAENTQVLLEDGARAYVNHPRGARVDRGRLTVSSIYVWFRDDFGGSDAGVLDHLRRYATPPLQAALAPVRTTDGHAYDWSLNDAR
jgi:Protein of unknown function, DUF547